MRKRLPTPEQKAAAREAEQARQLLAMSRKRRRAYGIRLTRERLLAILEAAELRAAGAEPEPRA